MLVQRHLLIKNVTERLEGFRMNTLVSAFMEFINEVTSLRQAPEKETVEAFIIAIAPFAPHFAEELWGRTGHQPTVFHQKWPAWDEHYTTFDTVEIAVQVGGKTRGTIRVSADASEDVVVAAAMADPAISKFIDGRQVRKRIFVKGKILNLVVL
jgi:leucyl-tRNA synthetase